MPPPFPTPAYTEGEEADIPEEEPNVNMSGNEDESEDEGNGDRNLIEPFDVSLEPGSMTSKNHPTQNVTLRAALLDATFDESQGFSSQHVYNHSLENLKKKYEAGSKKNTLNKMGQRSRIQWRGSEHVVPSRSNDIHWKIDDYFLDLLICRGRDVGIAALLPNVEVHHAIEFKLELALSPRTFSAKFAHLEFDPVGAMHYIGRTHRGEDAWISWIPNEAIGFMLDEQDPIAPGTCSGSTRLSQRHYYGSFMYFAGELNDMGHRDIYLWDRYPDLDDDVAVRGATNLW